MFRYTHSLLSLIASASQKNLEEVIVTNQHVWNIDFCGKSPLTHVLNFHCEQKPAVPFFNILDIEGRIQPSMNKKGLCLSPEEEDKFMNRTLAERIIKTMVRQSEIDKCLLDAQRQGRISFYMTAQGEEATIVGAAAGLQPQDEAFLQYREAGFLHYRGYTIGQMVAQCMGSCDCPLKGRQMPIHYGSSDLHVQVVGSSLATQIPHAAGAGYSFRLENEMIMDKLGIKQQSIDEPVNKITSEELDSHPNLRICVAFCGDGATSEGDFHVGLNFACTMGSHTLFIVRNNAYAISTSTREQYTGDGLIARGIAYGMPSIRVDGSDAFAVSTAVRAARHLILTTGRPVLLEAMTYRIGHHSTSDDSSTYRGVEEVKRALDFSPIERFEAYLVRKGWWSKESTNETARKARQETLSELKQQEKRPKWPIETAFDDVFKELTPELREQKEHLLLHYKSFKDQYNPEGI